MMPGPRSPNNLVTGSILQSINPTVLFIQSIPRLCNPRLCNPRVGSYIIGSIKVKFGVSLHTGGQMKTGKPSCCAAKGSGDGGYRSPYLPHAKRALYHLSYIPVKDRSNRHFLQYIIQFVWLMMEQATLIRVASSNSGLRNFSFTSRDTNHNDCRTASPIEERTG